jgi:hypothetical protein
MVCIYRQDTSRFLRIARLMRYPVLILVAISLTGTIAAVWAMVFGHLAFGPLILAVTFIVVRIVLQRLTQESRRRRPPPEA